MSTKNRMSAAEFQALHGSGIGNQDVSAKKPAIRLPKANEPNKTEAEYGRILKIEFPTCRVIYEGITFRMEAGNYTADWTVWYDDRLVLAVEVKSSYRFHSAGRSHMAFKAARALWPNIRWRFAQRINETWTTAE